MDPLLKARNGFQQHRGFATRASEGPTEEELSERDYHRLSDLALGELMVKLEALLEELPDLTDADLEYQQVGCFPHSSEHHTLGGENPMFTPIFNPLCDKMLDWVFTDLAGGFNVEFGQPWDIRHQQAEPQQTDMDVVSSQWPGQVRHLPYNILTASNPLILLLLQHSASKEAKWFSSGGNTPGKHNHA